MRGSAAGLVDQVKRSVPCSYFCSKSSGGRQPVGSAFHSTSTPSRCRRAVVMLGVVTGSSLVKRAGADGAARPVKDEIQVAPPMILSGAPVRCCQMVCMRCEISAAGQFTIQAVLLRY